MNPTQELRPTNLRDLTPTVGSFADEMGIPVDIGTALWYKGRGDGSKASLKSDTHIESQVSDILREYAEERAAKGIKGIPVFVPGPIGAYVMRSGRPMPYSPREYHIRERTLARKVMLELRAKNNADLDRLAEGL